MSDDRADRQWTWKGVLLASLVAHLLIAVLVLPWSPESPQKQEQEIVVELVHSADLPPKPKAEALPPPSPPKAEKPQEPSAQVPPPANSPSMQQATQPALKLGVLYGDKNSGPRKSPDGKSADGGSASPAARPDTTEQNPPHILAVKTAAADQVPLGTSTKAPASQGVAQTQQASKLRAVETLFSQDEASDLTSMIAMGSMPRGERAGQLCTTELREQLLHASPAYSPEQIPLEPLQQGTLLDVPATAFLSNSQWYYLSYRCVVDEQATKVLAFAFQVGEPIPRSDWKSRNIPSQ